MSLATIFSRAQVGISAPQVLTEVHLAGGLPSLSIVGLPETVVKESKDRVRAALQTSQFEFPQRRITIALAPAELPKEGGRFDLPIAIGVLAASSQIKTERLAQTEFIGELGLNGELRAVRGVLPAVVASARAGRTIIVPKANAAEAALVKQAKVLVAEHLLDVCAWLKTGTDLPVPIAAATPATATRAAPDLADVRGQLAARRALEIAAAGGHNLLFYGPPGTGKTMLATRLPGILPPMTLRLALEAAALRSVVGADATADFRRRPIRTPHHTASAVALVGGGPKALPGEISLAHGGCLFLDELPEFDRYVLEVLREPIESGKIVISRANRQAEYPARFQLIAAMNPCPCGYLGDPSTRCTCSPRQIENYRRKISGPMLDRIDMHVEVPRLPTRALDDPPGEPTADVAARTHAAHRRQIERQRVSNAQLSGAELDRACVLSEGDRGFLQHALERLGLSARTYHRVQRVARTIADLDGQANIKRPHLTEALVYRSLDRATAITMSS